MRHHTVTATFSAPPDEVFAYLADIDNLPDWATDFARELNESRGKVILFRLPGQIERIDRNAVAAKSRPRIK